MSDPDTAINQERNPLTIGEAFPAGDAAGEWVLLVSMAMNDLTTLDTRIHGALDNDDPESGYFFRLLCGTLREIWRLFDVANKNPDVARLVDDMAPEAKIAYAQVRELFTRPDASKAKSWAEVHLGDVRNRTFHYPWVGSEELRQGVAASRSEQALVRADAADPSSRPFEFADVVALQTSFGDIDQPEERARYEQIVETSQDILKQLVPVVWSALGTYLRARRIDPRRLTETARP
jgi:hypothetical protein